MSRSLAACEGSLLVVDTSQRWKAQTLASGVTASWIDANQQIVPVLNKIDLLAARPTRSSSRSSVIGLDASDAVLISAKTGLNIEVLEALVTAAAAEGGSERGAEGAGGG